MMNIVMRVIVKRMLTMVSMKALVMQSLTEFNHSIEIAIRFKIRIRNLSRAVIREIFVKRMLLLLQLRTMLEMTEGMTTARMTTASIRLTLVPHRMVGGGGGGEHRGATCRAPATAAAGFVFRPGYSATDIVGTESRIFRIDEMSVA